MLVFLIVQVSTGLVADDEIYITGPLRDYVNSEMSSWATGKHGLLADILLGLVVLHVAAILFYWLVKKINLVTPMISGYKRNIPGDDRFAEYSKLGALVAVAISAMFAYGVFNWL